MSVGLGCETACLGCWHNDLTFLVSFTEQTISGCLSRNPSVLA